MPGFLPNVRTVPATTGLVVCVVAWLACGAEPPPPATAKASTIEALREFNSLIGSWRGIGQVKRGSNQGSWQEKAELVWELKPRSRGIRINIEEGKEWKTALLTVDESGKTFTLTAKLPDETVRKYEGKFDDKRLVLEGTDDRKDVHRLTLTILNENRMLVLFEMRPEQQSFFNRIGEVGYQRQGTRLAVAGGTGPVCVVTGGAGTIPVTYKGMTYYVCCTGCRDAFNDDPAGILAEYEKKKAAAK